MMFKSVQIKFFFLLRLRGFQNIASANLSRFSLTAGPYKNWRAQILNNKQNAARRALTKTEKHDFSNCSPPAGPSKN